MLFSIRLMSVCILAPITVSMLLLLTTTQLSIFLFIICLISSWEWGKMMKFSIYMHQFWMYIMIGLLYVVMDLTVFQNYRNFDFWKIFEYICSVIILWWIMACLLVLFYPDSSIFWKNSNTLRCCFGILMIIPFFWATLTLHQFYYISNNGDIIDICWLLYMIVLVWINDSSAYVFGQIFGKYKLLKKVSPKKTWEGFLGGALTAIGSAWLLYIYIPIFTKPLIVFICSIIAIFSATIGDFTESMFKRDSGIKDTGNLIPGHGGILDRIDSLIAAIPIFTCLILLMYTGKF